MKNEYDEEKKVRSWIERCFYYVCTQCAHLARIIYENSSVQFERLIFFATLFSPLFFLLIKQIDIG